MYYTTTLAIIMAIVAIAATTGAGYVLLRWDTGTYWSNAKIAVVWGSVAVALVAIAIAIAAPVTSMVEARKTARGLGDGPRFTTEMIDGRMVDGITEMADNFPNVATKCVWDGWRGFVTSNGDFLAVVPDETCEYVQTGPNYQAARS